MKSDNYYDITSLPGLGELGTVPPLSFSQLRDHLADNPTSRAVVDVLFLLDDLVQREAFLAGEIEQVAPSVLTADQVRNEAPLPRVLAGAGQTGSRPVEVDRLWDAYFRYAAGSADRLGSAFLAGWVGYEVALRNALARERSARLGLEPNGYLVAADLGDTDEDLTHVVDEWSSSATPLAGLGVVTAARWAWISAHDAWFSFNHDELAAYAARLVLLGQWRRVTESGTGESSRSAERTGQ